MRLAGVLFGKQSEEHKHITHPDALSFEMGLRRAALAKRACPIFKKHGIVMAKIIRAQLASARFGGMDG